MYGCPCFCGYASVIFFSRICGKGIRFPKGKRGHVPHYCSCNVALQMSASKKNHQTKKWISPQLCSISVLIRKEGECNSCLNIHVQIFFHTRIYCNAVHPFNFWLLLRTILHLAPGKCKLIAIIPVNCLVRLTAIIVFLTFSTFFQKWIFFCLKLYVHTFKKNKNFKTGIQYKIFKRKCIRFTLWFSK